MFGDVCGSSCLFWVRLGLLRREARKKEVKVACRSGECEIVREGKRGTHLGFFARQTSDLRVLHCVVKELVGSREGQRVLKGNEGVEMECFAFFALFSLVNFWTNQIEHLKRSRDVLENGVYP